MSSSKQTDPRMLLPDWLRDGEAPLPAAVELQPMAEVAAPVTVAKIEEEVEVIDPAPFVTASVAPATPYSDRLSLDTRLDPGQLVSAEDLPSWLGGLERMAEVPVLAVATATSATPQAGIVTIEDPVVYDGVDAPDDGVIDVQVNGWYVIVAAIGLLILLVAALRLYLS